MRSQLIQIQEAVSCLLMSLSDSAAKNDIEIDITDLKNKFEK